jgi:hypothetical protein
MLQFNLEWVLTEQMPRGGLWHKWKPPARPKPDGGSSDAVYGLPAH